MKTTITTTIKQLTGDRPLLLLSLLIVGLTTAYVIYVGFSLHPSDLQVATRYTAFGDTQYYRNKWYYLLSFIVFAIIVGAAHIGVMAKLQARDMRPLALAFGWLTVLLLVVFGILTHSILTIAFLS